MTNYTKVFSILIVLTSFIITTPAGDHITKEKYDVTTETSSGHISKVECGCESDLSGDYPELTRNEGADVYFYRWVELVTVCGCLDPIATDLIEYSSNGVDTYVYTSDAYVWVESPTVCGRYQNRIVKAASICEPLFGCDNDIKITGITYKFNEPPLVKGRVGYYGVGTYIYTYDVYKSPMICDAWVESPTLCGCCQNKIVTAGCNCGTLIGYDSYVNITDITHKFSQPITSVGTYEYTCDAYKFPMICDDIGDENDEIEVSYGESASFGNNEDYTCSIDTPKCKCYQNKIIDDPISMQSCAVSLCVCSDTLLSASLSSLKFYIDWENEYDENKYGYNNESLPDSPILDGPPINIKQYYNDIRNDLDNYGIPCNIQKIIVFSDYEILQDKLNDQTIVHELYDASDPTNDPSTEPTRSPILPTTSPIAVLNDVCDLFSTYETVASKNKLTRPHGDKIRINKSIVRIDDYS
eukprot:434577_1